MILVDSSVWIALLRGEANPRMGEFITANVDELATTDPITMEILAGSRRPDDHEQMLSALAQRPVDPELDYRHAAAIYRAVRRTGHTVRSLNDCLIAAVALRLGDSVAHRDADFERIAEVTGLKHVRV